MFQLIWAALWIYLLTSVLGLQSCWPRPDGFCSCLPGHLAPSLSSLGVLLLVGVFFLFEGKMRFVTFAYAASVLYSWKDLFQCLNSFFTHPSLPKHLPCQKYPSSPMWLSTTLFLLPLPFAPLSICQSVTSSQIVKRQAVPHPSPPPSNSPARRITSVSAQINLGFIWLSNGFKALVS